MKPDSAMPPEYANLVRFAATVEAAATALSADYASRGVAVSLPAKRRAHRVRALTSWYAKVMTSSFDRLDEVLAAFGKEGLWARERQPIEMAVFRWLSELTPARPQLLALVDREPERAAHELVVQLTIVREQFEEAARLVVPAGEAEQPDAGFRRQSSALLERAGGGLTLTEAASELGITRQGLHKRVVSNGALAMMVDGNIILPKLQFALREGKTVVLPGVGRVAKLFSDTQAGPWSALQFLVDRDPNLGCPPIEALSNGSVREVEHAARAYLGVDEE